jgi:hypothetical protein
MQEERIVMMNIVEKNLYDCVYIMKIMAYQHKITILSIFVIEISILSGTFVLITYSQVL